MKLIYDLVSIFYKSLIIACFLDLIFCLPATLPLSSPVVSLPALPQIKIIKASRAGLVCSDIIQLSAELFILAKWLLCWTN